VPHRSPPFGPNRAGWGYRGAALLLAGAVIVGGLIDGPVAGGETAAGSGMPSTPPTPAVVPLNCSGPLTLSLLATPASGASPLSVAFTAQVAGGCAPYRAEWEFGDGGEGSGLTPTHVYRSAGYFHVQAEVTDANNSGREATTTVVVTGGAGQLVVSVGAAPASGTAPLTLELWANVTGGNVSSQLTTSWDFGDGGTGAGSPVTHRYSAPGTYLARADVHDTAGNAGSGNLSIRVTAGGPPPVANLTLSADPETGSAPLPVTVSVFSNGAASADRLAVCFGDGSPCANGPAGWDGTAPSSFAHTYAAPGNFTLTGTLTNSTGATVAGATAVVVVTPVSTVVVGASLLPSTGSAPLPVELVATVSGGTAPYAIEWAFGDGSVGSSVPGEPVTHTYRQPGTYHPTVSVTDGAGHTAAALVGPVTVSGASGIAGLPAAYGGVPTPILLGLAIGAAATVGLLIGWRRQRRRHRTEWQQEGEELVRELEQQR
jgi:PKD repeat protein